MKELNNIVYIGYGYTPKSENYNMGYIYTFIGIINSECGIHFLQKIHSKEKNTDH